MLLIQIKLNHYLCPIVADFMGFSGGLVGKESACNVGDLGSVGKILWRRAWQPTPVFFAGESPRTEDPGGLQSTGRNRSVMTE